MQDGRPENNSGEVTAAFTGGRNTIAVLLGVMQALVYLNATEAPLYYCLVLYLLSALEKVKPYSARSVRCPYILSSL